MVIWQGPEHRGQK